VSRFFYFDNSALIKLYHQESGTEQAEEIFRQAESTLVISELAIVELYSTLARKVRIGEITPEAQNVTRSNFEDDCTQRFIVMPLDSAVIQKSKELLQRYGNTKALRTLDALHLATCLMAQTRENLVFVCADRQLLDVGQAAGLQTLNPELCSD
jgi:uncharacterized protein